MRPEQQRLERRVRPGAFANDVPGHVDGRVEPRLAHQAHHVRASLLVEFTVRGSAHASVLILAELGERHEVLGDPVAVDAECIRVLRTKT